MAVDYRNLVTSLLLKKMYPVLRDFVVLELYFKLIPEDIVSDHVQTFDRRYDNPMDVWKLKSNPFHLSYLVGSTDRPLYHLHECDELNVSSFPLACRRIKISRSFIDQLLQRKSKSFEEELYHLWTLVNFNLPKIAHVLDIDDMTCTRFLPQFIKLWVYAHDVQFFRPSTVGRSVRSHFGPVDSDGLLPIRLVRGRLSPCTSRATLLSLNDDLGVALPVEYEPYTLHYVERHHTLIPLAYNPLENPLV